jgi:hypothetical protein
MVTSRVDRALPRYAESWHRGRFCGLAGPVTHQATRIRNGSNESRHIINIIIINIIINIIPVRTFSTSFKAALRAAREPLRRPPAPCRFAPGAGRRWPPRARRTRRSPEDPQVGPLGLRA